MWPPHFRETFSLGLDVLKGADHESSLTINAQGMRGDPLPEDERYRLLAIGGSTTICTYLDDGDAWPLLVQRRLEQDLGEGSVWVGNVGRPGHITAHHRLQLEKLLAQYPEIDAVLMLVGINDMLSRVSSLRDPIVLPPPGSHQLLRGVFSIFPGWDADSPWYRRTRIAQLLATRSWRLPGQRAEGPLVDARGEFVVRARDYRRQARSFLEPLPGLPDGLAAYQRSLNEIVDAAQVAGVRLIFLTQPTLWRGGAQHRGRGQPVDGRPALRSPGARVGVLLRARAGRRHGPLQSNTSSCLSRARGRVHRRRQPAVPRRSRLLGRCPLHGDRVAPPGAAGGRLPGRASAAGASAPHLPPHQPEQRQARGVEHREGREGRARRSRACRTCAPAKIGPSTPPGSRANINAP